MGSLIPEKDLEAARQKYVAEEAAKRASLPPVKTRGEILVEVYREDPTLSIAELAEASSRSERWVRKTLREAGLAIPRAPRRRRVTEGEHGQ